MTETSPDPVASPDAYRRELLGWLGDDDPTLVQAGTTERMHEVVAASGPHLRDRPAPTEWSVIETLGHILDSEIVASARVRWIVAEDEPDIVGYDQDHWVDGLGHRDDDPEELITLFDSLRRANLRLYAASPEAARERVGLHRERGRESYELIWRLLAGHDRLHVAQAQRALEAVRGG